MIRTACDKLFDSKRLPVWVLLSELKTKHFAYSKHPLPHFVFFSLSFFLSFLFLVSLSLWWSSCDPLFPIMASLSLSLFLCSTWHVFLLITAPFVWNNYLFYLHHIHGPYSLSLFLSFTSCSIKPTSGCMATASFLISLSSIQRVTAKINQLSTKIVVGVICEATHLTHLHAWHACLPALSASMPPPDCCVPSYPVTLPSSFHSILLSTWSWFTSVCSLRNECFIESPPVGQNEGLFHSRHSLSRTTKTHCFHFPLPLISMKRPCDDDDDEEDVVMKMKLVHFHALVVQLLLFRNCDHLYGKCSWHIGGHSFEIRGKLWDTSHELAP